MMVNQRLSTGDPRLDRIYDLKDEAASRRMLYEAGKDPSKFIWCQVHKRRESISSGKCFGCVYDCKP